MTDSTSTTATSDQANFGETDITFSPIIGEGAAAHRIARVADAFIFDVPCSDNEPRIRDLDLAEKLGFTQPRDIRKLIKRFVSAGDLPGVDWRATVARQSTGNGASREYTTQEAWLTEAQALFVIAKSETEKAKHLLREMIAVVMLVRRGLLRMSANDELAADVASLKVQTAANTQAIADLTKLVTTTLSEFGKALTAVVSDVAAIRANQHGAGERPGEQLAHVVFVKPDVGGDGRHWQAMCRQLRHEVTDRRAHRSQPLDPASLQPAFGHRRPNDR